MGTKVGVVYDAVTKKLMQVIVPEADSELDDPAFNQPGTKQLRVDAATYFLAAGRFNGLDAVIAEAEAQLAKAV